MEDEVHVVIRNARPDEYEQVGEMCVSAYRAGGHLRDGDPYENVLRRVAERADAGTVLVLADEELLLGTVTICPPGTAFAEIGRPGECEFRFLAVAPSAWGRGLGPMLVDACDDRARQMGATALSICVISVNDTAQRMYERLGFRRMPERDWSPVAGVELLAFTRPVSC